MDENVEYDWFFGGYKPKGYQVRHQDHETQLIDQVMTTWTPEQWEMMESDPWLEYWFQDFANYQNGVR